MNRPHLCFSVLLLSCCAAVAQTAGPAAATATPPITSTQATTVAQFQKIEDTWSDSVNKRDQYGLELVLSPLLVDVSASGDVTTRNQQVAQLITGDDKTVYLTQKVITVRMLGDVAVANGTYSLQHKVDGKPVDEKGVFTHVFQQVRGGWLCVNSQRTALLTNSSAKEKQKQKKQSTTADEPFHIPFLSK
ncbi:MAG TPA: nuclear transport factor 2 family protein [Terracidiphilus sp.]|nr:nuclear transport factor 2 family protein [Terracidiphilus sp.]